MKLQGKIVNWNDDKGFGFIEPNGGGKAVFVHIKAFKSNAYRPIKGDDIIFEVVREQNDRYKAINAKFVKDVERPNKRIAHHSTRSYWGSFIFFFGGFLLVAVVTEFLPLIIAGAYCVMSLVTYVAYAIDKSAAQNGRWRTKESTLHLFALLGGWPGALLAQQTLRHKSRKEAFTFIYKITVFLNLCFLIWLKTEKGAVALNHVLSL